MFDMLDLLTPFDSFGRDATDVQVHNRLVDALGNIRVFARVRPILKHEMKSGEGRDVTAFPDEDVLQLDAVSAAGRVEPGGSGRFDFDRVFSKASSQVCTV